MPLTLLDYSDRELLHIVHEVAEENGGSANSSVIAEALGMTTKERVHSVGSRMSAMKRFGVIEKVSRASAGLPVEWKLTELGKVMAFGKTRKAQDTAISGARPEELLLMVRAIGNRQGDNPDAARHLIRREWMRSTRRNGR